MPIEKKTVSVAGLLDEKFEAPIVPKKLLKAVAFENLVKRQYRRDKKFRNMYIKLKNALTMGKIGAVQLSEYFRKALKESVNRTAVKWVTVEFYELEKKTVKKKKPKKQKKVKKKKAKKKT